MITRSKSHKRRKALPSPQLPAEIIDLVIDYVCDIREEGPPVHERVMFT
jgi:hypothetical protein